MERILTYDVTEKYAGCNIKTFLKQHYKMSTSLIKVLKNEEDGICVNGERKHVTYILNSGDKVKLTIREGQSENIEPVFCELDIVYEDEDVIVINKPPYMPTHPSQGNYTNTVANALMYYFNSKGEERTFHAVNRLDKDTSGLMLAAKNGYAHARLCENIHSCGVERRYTAIVCGDIQSDGTVDAPIAREDGSTIKRKVSAWGQRAVTHYSVKKRLGKYTLVALRLETGRTHQIRVHMAHIGHPLLGDWLYGEEDKQLFSRHALHSDYIRFLHPVTNEIMEFSIPLEEEMKNFVDKCDKTY